MRQAHAETSCVHINLRLLSHGPGGGGIVQMGVKKKKKRELARGEASYYFI